MLNPIDKIVESALKTVERNIGVLRSHFNYDGLWFVDKDVAKHMTTKVEYLAKSVYTPSQLAELMKRSSYPDIVKPILLGVIQIGQAPAPKELKEWTENELSKDAKVMFPYLLNSLTQGRSPLACFETPRGKRQWFACYDEAPLKVGVVSYGGKRITFDVKEMASKKYRRLNIPQTELTSLCRKDLERKSPDDVRMIAFQIGKNVLPEMNYREANSMLNSFLSKIIEVPLVLKPEKGVNQPPLKQA